jgi:predicted phage terminase large subunit-like protein
MIDPIFGFDEQDEAAELSDADVFGFGTDSDVDAENEHDSFLEFADDDDEPSDDDEASKPAREIHIGPQKGPQEQFLSTTADIAIYGGAAGGGKTFALLLEPLRHHNNPRFGCVCFRRNSKQVRNEGGLWHESMKLYLPLGGEPRQSTLEWTLPSGARISFGHLEYDASVQDWHGSQIPLIMFDELTNFTRYQFFYMLSRNRSDSGVPGYVRATCNPDVDSWVREFIDWWIDGNGWPIPERAGVLRWFIQIDDKLIWADSKAEIAAKYGEKFARFATSVTFIPAKLDDNKKLLENDPAYEVKLMALNRVERMRLKDGNWNVRLSAGDMFRREWFQMVDAIPAGWIDDIRYWDRAATPVSPANPNPDWTRGVRMLRYPDNTFLVADMRSLRGTPDQVDKLIKSVAAMDGPGTTIMSQCDPGSAGKAEAMHFTRMLAGYRVFTETLTKNKATRAKPFSAQVEAGNVKMLRAPWNNEYFSECESFPSDREGVHDDIIDASSGGFNKLSKGLNIFETLSGGE